MAHTVFDLTPDNLSEVLRGSAPRRLSEYTEDAIKSAKSFFREHSSQIRPSSAEDSPKPHIYVSQHGMLGFTYDDGNLHLCDGMGATIEGYFKGSEVICCVDCALGTPCEERVPGYTSADGTWRPVKHLGGRPADALSKAAAEFTEATDVIYDNGHRGGNVVAQAEDGALKWTVKDYGERFLRASTERLDGHGEAVFVHIAVVLSDGRVGRYSSPQAPEMPAAVAECFRDFSLSRQ